MTANKPAKGIARKPTHATISYDQTALDQARKSAANNAIDQFEQNLLEALEEV